MAKAKFELGQIVVCTEYDLEDQVPMRIYAIDDSRTGHPEVLYTCVWDDMTPEQDDWNPFLESQLAPYRIRALAHILHQPGERELFVPKEDDDAQTR